jgi:hypothetical protein
MIIPRKNRHIALCLSRFLLVIYEAIKKRLLLTSAPP